MEIYLALPGGDLKCIAANSVPMRHDSVLYDDQRYTVVGIQHQCFDRARLTDHIITVELSEVAETPADEQAEESP
jgi:hypothetical protein